MVSFDVHVGDSWKFLMIVYGVFFRTLRKLLIHILSCHKLFCFTFFSIPIYNITYHSCSFVGASLAKYFTLPTNGLHAKFDTA